MLRWIYTLVATLLLTSSLLAESPQTDLVFDNVTVDSQVDAFGIEKWTAVGTVTNRGTMAYAEIVITGDVRDEEAEDVIGEAWGGLVDVCGSSLREPLQPGQTRRFAAPIDLFEDASTPQVALTIEAVPTVADGASDIVYPGVTLISAQEVGRVEWEDSTTLRYGVGCPTAVFTTYDWYRYALGRRDPQPIEHPSAALVTPELIEATELTVITQTRGRETNPLLFDSSMLIVAPDGSRVIYQNDLHDLYSIQPDGRFRRQVQTGLYQHTLQGYLFTPQGMFLTYYYGAYGDPVRYIVAAVRGGAASLGINQVTPSVTVPGLTTDGARAIISGTFPVQGEDVTGYYWQSVRSASRDLLFETNVLPGNNYPAPLFFRKDGGTRYIYIIRPINNQAMLQCFHYEARTLTTLTSLPLQLADSERAEAWLSPDGQTLALAATGAQGGLWQIDLAALPSCEADA